MRLRHALLPLAAAAGYAFYEPRRFRFRTVEVPVALGGDLSVLHVSDLHMRSSDAALQRFLAGVPSSLEATPDLVLATGDLIEDDSGIEAAVTTLNRLEARLGRFYVLGSHDYYQATRPSYLKYWTGAREPQRLRPASTGELESGLQEKGWRALTNRAERVESPAGTLLLAGVDDPYIDRHEVAHIRRTPSDALAIGLVHAPDVISEWALAGFDLVVAGHTHGGQVRLPGIGALVTNCSLPTGLASGLHPVGDTWLHVSPGLGSSRFAPVRFLAPPELTLLQLARHR